MNKNIKVINKNLWVVNFDYVKLGYIQGLPFTRENSSDIVTLTQDGLLVLNSNEDYQSILKYLIPIMKLSDDLIGTDKGFNVFIENLLSKKIQTPESGVGQLIEKYHLQNVKKVYHRFSDIEKQRRIIQKEYIKGNKKPLGMDKLTKIIKRKAGES